METFKLSTKSSFNATQSMRERPVKWVKDGLKGFANIIFLLFITPAFVSSEKDSLKTIQEDENWEFYLSSVLMFQFFIPVRSEDFFSQILIDICG